MGKDKITFTYGDAKITVKLKKNEKVKVNVKGDFGEYNKKDLENIFSAAATKGKLEQIKTLFDQTGNAGMFNLDEEDLAMLVTFDDGGNATTYESIADNIHKKYNEIQLKKENINQENINQENIIRDYFGDQNFNATGDNDGIVGANGSNQDNDENLNLVREETGLINNGASGSATNNAIDNRKNSLNDENLGNFTRMSDPVQKGDCLWNLAKKALQDEGKSYTNKDILERCAYIAKANNLTKKDKNDNLIIYPNRTYIVGFAQTEAGGTTVVAGSTTVVAGGTTVEADGTTVEAGGTTVKAGGTTVVAGGTTVKAGGTTVVAGGTTSAPVTGTTVKAGGTNPTDFDVQTIEEANNAVKEKLKQQLAERRESSEDCEISDETYDNTGKLISFVLKQFGYCDDIIELSYGNDGKLVAIKDVYKSYDDTVFCSYDYTYDADGKVLTKVRKDSDGVVDYTEDYTYDENGNVLTKVEKGSDGLVDYTYDYTYDADGNKTNCLKTNYRNDGETVDYTKDYTYGENGKLTGTVWTEYFSDGETVWYTENYTYDADGNETNHLMTFYEDDGETVDYTKNYTHDADGNKTKVVTKKYDSNVLIEEIEDNYDADALISSKVLYSRVAEDIYKGFAFQHKTILNSKVTSDNVVHVLQYWKKEYYPNNYIGIIEAMDKIAGGASVAQMEKIPQALVEYAKDKLDENNSALLALQGFMNDPSRVEKGDDPEDNDYAKGRANELDGLMDAVMKELGWM